MASQRSVNVGGVQIGGGAPGRRPDDDQDRDGEPRRRRWTRSARVADAGADIVRVAVPRDKDIEALKTIVVESPIPVIADIHFNHTLALKAIDAGAHCIRLNPGNIGGPGEGRRGRRPRARRRHADAHRRQLRLAAQAPARARAREPRRGARDRRRRVRRADGAAATSPTSRSRSSRRTCPTRSPPTAC